MFITAVLAMRTLTKLLRIKSEVNLISCANINVACLIENFGINADAVCVQELVEDNKDLSAE